MAEGVSFLERFTGWNLQFMQTVRELVYIKASYRSSHKDPGAEVMLWTKSDPPCTQLVVRLKRGGRKKWLTACGEYITFYLRCLHHPKCIAKRVYVQLYVVKSDWDEARGWLKKKENVASLGRVDFCRGTRISRGTLSAISTFLNNNDKSSKVQIEFREHERK